MLIKNFIFKCHQPASLSRLAFNLNNNKNLYYSTHQSSSSSTNNSQLNLNKKVFLKDKYSNFTFDNLNALSKILSKQILDNLNCSDLKGEKIAVLCSNNYTYLVSLLAIWRANGVALGLNKQYPTHLVEYFLNDSNCKLVINGVDPNDSSKSDLENVLNSKNVINNKLNESEFYKLNLKQEDGEGEENSFETFRNILNLPDSLKKEALILYTSGTSGPPKGVVLTKGNLTSTVETLRDLWQWTPNDCLLHTLPLNHVHGLIYGLLTVLYSGGQVDMLAKFNADLVWSKLLDRDNNVNTFMAVPTIFVNLVNAYLRDEKLQKKYPKDYVKEAFRTKLRLVASGSAPLNVKTYNEWKDITGYTILERYGMTEIGLGLSSVYEETATAKRIVGTVGRPYGGTFVRIVEQNDSNKDHEHVLVESDSTKDVILDLAKDKQIFGELQIKGPMVFKEYLGKPVQTKETFTEDGWFKTGDTAEFLRDSKVYKIIGRTSVDVIKSGGYKISALDIERELLSHPQIDDVAVLGLSDPVWGQRIFSLIVLKKEYSASQFSLDELKKWCLSRMPKYSVPTLVKLIDVMPRNQLGKVNKKELVKKYEAEYKTN